MGPAFPPKRRVAASSLLVPLGLLALLLAAYGNSLHGPFVFDDLPAIQTNLSIRDLSDLGTVLNPPNEMGTTVNGRPLVNLSFALNYAIGQQNVYGYHGLNLGIHAAAALALYGLIRRLLAAHDQAKSSSISSTLLAGGAAAIWALHPLQTQAVTYIVQRAESLVGLFIVLTLYCFVRSQSAGGAWRWRVASVGACLLGVLSKEVVVAAPLLVLLCDRAFYAGTFRQAWRRNRAYYYALFATWLPLALLIIGSRGRGGTVGFNLAGVSGWTYLLTQADAITRYVGTALWPAGLVFDYGTGVVAGLAEVWWQGCLVLALLAATVLALVRSPKLGFIGAWFFLILAPSSSFVPIVTETMAEHRMYLPLVSVVGLWVVLVVRLRPQPVGLIWLGASLAIVLGGLTCRRNLDYRTMLGLWQSSATNFPRSARAHNNLGELLGKVRKFDLAVVHLQEAIRLQPTYLDALCNLGGILSQVGRLGEAMILMEGMAKAHPREASVQGTYGGVLYRAGRTAEAEAQFNRALELAPLDIDAHNNLGVCLYDRNLADEALKHFEIILLSFPDDAGALYNQANALVKLGRTGEGETALRQSLKLDPQRAEAHNNLGALLAQRGLTAEAIGHFRQAVEFSPAYADALNNLGVMLAGSGQTSEAVSLFQRALRARPDYPDAQINLQRALEAAARSTGH